MPACGSGLSRRLAALVDCRSGLSRRHPRHETWIMDAPTEARDLRHSTAEPPCPSLVNPHCRFAPPRGLPPACLTLAIAPTHHHPRLSDLLDRTRPLSRELSNKSPPVGRGGRSLLLPPHLWCAHQRSRGAASDLFHRSRPLSRDLGTSPPPTDRGGREAAVVPPHLWCARTRGAAAQLLRAPAGHPIDDARYSTCPTTDSSPDAGPPRPPAVDPPATCWTHLGLYPEICPTSRPPTDPGHHQSPAVDPSATC